MAWSRRFIPKLFVWHSSRDIVRMKWRYYRAGLYTEKKSYHWLKQWPIRKGLGDEKRRSCHWLKMKFGPRRNVGTVNQWKVQEFRRSLTIKRILFVCREEDSKIWWESLPGRRDQMKCELERGRRICPYCNVRHIGRCQEDLDRWRIREIVGEWCPYQGGEGFDGCVEWDLTNLPTISRIRHQSTSSWQRPMCLTLQ